MIKRGFQLQPVIYDNIEKCIKMTWNGGSTGYDHIPASITKPVSEFLVWLQ